MVITCHNLLNGSHHKAFSGHNFDAVDSNLVRYYRTEYGSRWKEELNHYLYNKNQKKGSQ